MLKRMSLAKKSGLVFGAAIVALVLTALAVPWLRIEQTVDNGQIETTRQVAQLWEDSLLVNPSLIRALRSGREANDTEDADIRLHFYPLEEWNTQAFERSSTTSFEQEARDRFNSRPALREHTSVTRARGARVYLYAKRLLGETSEDAYKGVLIIERRSESARSQLLVDRTYFVLAAFLTISLSLVMLYLIMRKIVLKPVRHLRKTTESVREGNLHVRAEIDTGDEFQHLAEALNQMLSTIEEKQDQLRSVNRTLDLKLTELAERNVALYETARLKGEFLASISHELRTPLNSIIGFAEILQDIVATDQEADPDNRQLAKRVRYLDNIVSAGRTLLEMINELLTMARLDAGTMEVRVGPMSVAETAEGLLTLITPLADRKSIELHLDLGAENGASLPVIETDAQKLQQIVFNFLSNAIKFTTEGGRVTLRAEMLQDTEGVERIRFSVLDTGIGIPTESQRAVFERFHQLDSGHDRAHAGTGLGLAIANELADLLDGELFLESEVGRGSMFSVIVPLSIQGGKKPSTLEELAAQRTQVTESDPPQPGDDG